MSEQQDAATIIRNNLRAVRDRILAACDRAGRCASTVQLVAVTKYAEWEWVEALAVQHSVFGENRPQQLAERAAQLPKVEWHLIGQLQRNKVRLALAHATVIHSIDSLRLLRKIATVASETGRRPNVLLEVNIAGEESKSGFSPAELTAAWSDIVAVQQDVNITGLMGMAPASPDTEVARSVFRRLAELRDQLAGTELTLPELSMGMSGDFEAAVEEGSTMVRIGSRLFEGLT